MKKYEKFASHELHLFVYFKDEEFFDLVVKSHIKNKFEKDLIDYFLLDDKQKVKEYLRPDFIQDNVHEQILLLLCLKDLEECKDSCQAFFEMMKMKDSKRKYDIRDFKLKYDTVLSSQKSKDDVLGAPPPPAPDRIVSVPRMANTQPRVYMGSMQAPMSNINMTQNLSQNMMSMNQAPMVSMNQAPIMGSMNHQPIQYDPPHDGFGGGGFGYNSKFFFNCISKII